MKPALCWLLGHSRGPISDRIDSTPTGIGTCIKMIRYCGCCGRRADSFSLVRKVQYGEMIPRGYGIAWIRYNAPIDVVMPIPFNLVAAAIRRAIGWTKFPRGLVDNPGEAYRQGLREGRAQGRREEWRAMAHGTSTYGPDGIDR